MRPEQRKQLGAKLFLARKIKNYTQQQVALRLNISQAHYQKIEAGRVGVDFLQLFALSQMFEIGIRECLEPIVGEARIAGEYWDERISTEELRKRLMEVKAVAEDEFRKRDEVIARLKKSINRLE